MFTSLKDRWKMTNDCFCNHKQNNGHVVMIVVILVYAD